VALNDVSTDSAKLLTEKLALTRELSNLKPELEHLRSQTETHQSLLSEKLSLQRQLSTAQVKLETEKRATQRFLAKEEKTTEKDGRLEHQLEELRKELARERRDRQKVEQDAQKEFASWEGRKAVLEGKLDAFRNKLRTTKEQLKQTEAELQKAQISTTTLTSRAILSGNYEKSVRNPRKRSATHLDMDATIGTPGVLPPAKHGKRGSTLPGDKSTFSITPFLNRTASVAPDTPREAKALEHAGEHNEEVPPPVEPSNDTPSAVPTTSFLMAPKSKVTKRVTTAKTAVETHTLGTAKTGKINTKAPPPRKRPVVPSLENVAEEQNDENEPPAEVTAITDEASQNTEATSESHAQGEQMEPRKRKRKLLGSGLGKTLFDDDDGETIKARVRGPLGVVRGFGVLGKGGLVGAKGSLRVGSTSAAGVFGSFSPLKKDKKASTER